MNLLRAVATVSGITLLSRITGLVRENLTASIFGASAFTDAFFVAFRLPNLLRRMFAEGAFSQAFVPLLAQARAEGDEAGMRLMVDRIATALFWVLVAVSLAGVAAAPALVWLMASGLSRDPAAYDAAVVMTRWMFPYILFISMVALSAGILNTWKRFAVPAFSPVLLNLCFIGAALGLSRHFDPPVYALAVGVIAGGIAQLAIQVPALRRIGMLPRIGLGVAGAFRDPHTRRLLTLMAPAVLAVSVAQISLVINTHIASRLAPGSVSWVSYADRLMEFPIALLGVALGTVLLPSLSRASASGEVDEYSGLLDWGLRLVFVLSLPCMAGLALMAEPLTALLFHYGRFGAHDVAMTRMAVIGYAAGLLGLIAIKVLAPGFYAKQDVRTPVKIGLLVLVVTQLLNLVLVPVIAHAGLALSISLGAWANAGLLLAGLRRRGLYRPRAGWLRLSVQVGAATLAMAAMLAATVPRFDWIAMHATPLLRIGAALGLVALGAALYLAVLLLAGIRPRQFRRRSRDD
ncbi:murein biosynthesis integral membrane protein MurJ [Quisquiliibacterium transsilvanicum]|uniref:Probable lipid II flippase MurJ n=1 Tax=Quisquiliibacterium transsilvanicum TaxID=1549638 RepID=A0A7W8HF39_9BURK|nr:murein biosynthesis integral membrane protein MurJ [Quisquiliibacterium transsilvanicum]MBB5270723.1 putative peptidoglycan lipid II flippase [Quisquiliibacterium transsilvanicum]